MSESAERAYHHGGLRSALLAAAERTVREQGVVQLSLRELAREVGVSHGAPRRHFPDRQALLDALAVTGFERLDQQLRAALTEADEDFGSGLRVTMAAYIRFATDNAALAELMFAAKHRPGADHVVVAATPAFALMDELVVRGQHAGELTTDEPEQIGIVLFATMQGIATLINGDMVARELIDDLVGTAVDQFLRGTPRS